jgi:hypothetical protein
MLNAENKIGPVAKERTKEIAWKSFSLCFSTPCMPHYVSGAERFSLHACLHRAFHYLNTTLFALDTRLHSVCMQSFDSIKYLVCCFCFVSTSFAQCLCAIWKRSMG